METTTAHSVSAPTRTLTDHLAVIKGRKNLLLSVAGAIFAIAIIAAIVWPATYQSSATILIEQQEVPAELVRSTISSYADQRIQTISQRVMTTENLLGLIKRYNLYPSRQKRDTREALMKRMRDDIKFGMISADVIDPRFGHPTKATIAFTVSYQNSNPATAAKVANDLVSLYLNENLTNRKQLAADAATFLTEESKRLRDHIADLESSIATFKEKHHDELPELSQLNVQLSSRTEDELRDVDTQIRSAEQQLVYLDAQLAQISPSSQVYTSTGERVLSPSDRLKFLRTEYARVSGLYAPTHPDVIRIKREIEGLEKTVGQVDTANDLARQLEDAKTQLAEVHKKYADDHPDVVRLQRLVDSLEAAMKTAPQTSAVAAAIDKPDNPAYIQVRAQREATATELASLKKKRAALHDKLTDYENRLANAPAVEREYTALARELENSQLKYRETSAKQGEAQLAQNLETERKGERFTLIEPPLVPEEPVSPNRVAIIVLGFVFALAAGVGSVLLSDSMDGRIHGRNDIESLLSVPPLAVLPWIETSEDRLRRRQQQRYAWIGAACSIVIMLALMHLFYKPLDVLWAVAMRHLGV